jgi:hypothetical protein
MESSGMLRRVALVRTDVSEEPSVSFIRVTRIGQLGTTLAATSIVHSSLILVTLMKALGSSETSVLTIATRRNIPEHTILHDQNKSALIKDKLLVPVMIRRGFHQFLIIVEVSQSQPVL